MRANIFGPVVCKTLLCLAGLSLFGIANASELVNVKLFDHESITGKLDLPNGSDPVKAIVIFVPGTGPGTYLNRRKLGTYEFNYFDLFSQEFNRRGVGFFAYNKRGVTLGDQPPAYETIDRAKFAKAVPHIEVQDIGSIITTLRANKRLRAAKVILLGWSEGTILASMAAENPKNRIDAIFLAGYANDNLFDIIRWQFSGASSILNLNKYFDTNHDGVISREEFESTEETPTKVRANMLQGAKFEQLDVNKDGTISSEDFKRISAPIYASVLDAVKRGDGDWIWKNYFHVSVEWLREHFSLEANKSRLTRLNLPIYIFQGTEDASCPVDGARDLQKRFEVLGKSNLHCNIYEAHGHDLNYLDFVTKKEIPAGIMGIFDTVAKMRMP